MSVPYILLRDTQCPCTYSVQEHRFQCKGNSIFTKNLLFQKNLYLCCQSTTIYIFKPQTHIKMKQLLTVFLFCCLSANTFAQDIIGKWWDEEKRGQTEIYKAATGKLYGKIVWLKVPNDPKTSKPQLDIHNKDKSKRDRDRKSTRLNSSHVLRSRMPSSA